MNTDCVPSLTANDDEDDGDDEEAGGPQCSARFLLITANSPNSSDGR